MFRLFSLAWLVCFLVWHASVYTLTVCSAFGGSFWLSRHLTGVAATCTRGRCPPGRGGEFFVTLACGGLQGACSAGGGGGGGGGGQGFSVVVGSGMVRVAGTGEPGLYYGVRTLCQLLRFYARPSRAGESALGIPCCILRDEPDVVRRSLVLDVR